MTAADEVARGASRSSSVRERTRAALTAEILEAARRQLARDGAAGISLRAVSREMGMASSAVYRYFPSRDDLLTQLIVDAYDSLGLAVERAEAEVARDDLAGRFRAVARALRRWAMAHEHEYALIYGSPVPGYSAPESTIPPATRVPRLLIAIITDGLTTGLLAVDAADVPADAAFSLEPVVDSFRDPDAGAPPLALVARGLMAWTYLFGAVSFDLFGHRHNVVADERAPDHPFFEYEIDRMLELLGLVPAG